MASSSPLTTHILDTAKGCPAVNVPITVYIQRDTGWHVLGQGLTNSDGRCPNLLSKEQFVSATYKIHFDTKAYFQFLGISGFYPYVEVVFDIVKPDEHYHVPLLLSPYSYSTYRGS